MNRRKVTKKALLLILTVLLLLPLLAACGETDDGTEPGGTNGNTQNSTADAGGNTGGETPEPPSGEKPMKGYVFKAYVRSEKTRNPLYYCEDFMVESTKEDSLSFAVMERNSDIEDRFGCVIQKTDSTGDQYAEMETFYRGGVKYELAIAQTYYAGGLISSGLVQDFRKEEYVDTLHLEEDYYDQQCISQMALGNKLYFLSGDMNISPLDTAVVTLFNQTLYEQYTDFEDPFQLVEEYRWTIETMLNYAKTATVVSMEGGKPDVINNGSDQAGYFEYEYSPLFYFYAAGERISTMQNDGYPDITLRESSRTADVVLRLHELLNVNRNNLPYGYNAVLRPSFNTGRVLFTDARLNEVRTQFYADDKVKYGILPVAMFEEAQHAYYSGVYFEAYVHFWMLPAMINNAQNATAIIDAMAEASAREDGVMDAYFRRTMELNAAPDSKSRDMLRLVRNSLVYDVALIYDESWGGFGVYLTGLDTANDAAFASRVSQLAVDKAMIEMDKLFAKIQNPKHP